MLQNYILFGIFIATILLCVLPEFMRHPGYAVLFLVRGVCSILLLYGIELLALKNAWEYYVQVNAMTASISALFGIPGVCLLYAIRIFL